MTTRQKQREPGTFPGAPALRSIVADGGEQWLAFRKNLKPKFWMAWTQIALSYLMLFAGVVAAGLLGDRLGFWQSIATAPLFGVWIGYWLHPLMLFGHEAAHFHLAAKRPTNDFLANLFVMSWVGLDVKLYRKIHWQHHLHLGRPDDTEISYHDKPSFAFLVQAFTGVYPVRKLLEYYGTLGRSSSGDEEGIERSDKIRWFVAMARTAVLHLGILGGCAVLGWYGAALAWVIGLVVFFPAFNMVRQILEHRSLEAVHGTDYSETEHGAVNRMFPSGPFSSTFGGAGFNRHLLHHWDPGVSYTRFDDMETFLGRTNVSTTIDDARTTYLRALHSLMTEPDDR